MSSRPAELAGGRAISSARRVLRPARRRWAMASWLMLHHMLSALVLLSVTSGFLYWGLQRGLLRASHDFLDHKLLVLEQILRAQPLQLYGLEQETRDEAKVSEQSQTPFFLRVLREDHSATSLIAETPGMAALAPTSVFLEASSDAGREGSWRTAEGKHLLLATRRVTATTASPGAHWTIQAAIDTDYDYRLLKGYRRDLLIVLGGGLLLAAASGAWVARRGLRPLADITRATERIGAQQLHDRIPVSAWPAELVALASAFNDMLDRLQDAFERLSQFSADLAHELRTPINNLMGEAQVALSQPRSTADYVRVLQSGLEEQSRLARMINSMLFLARADRSQTVLQTQGLQAGPEMRAVADYFEPLAQECGVLLRCEGEAALTADPLLLRRALSNLLSNALRHTPRGGNVLLQAFEAGEATSLRVTDSGTGIEAEHLPKLGRRFYRVDPARADGAEGAGLGLAIVISIMGLHGGRFEIASAVDRGTSVLLSFPKPPASPPR